ncbi:MAG: hypothetical protein EXQ67_08440 [Thermoleophilia bacterium]|nr:hypothetical protein [Thermoleophilia bacterium]
MSSKVAHAPCCSMRPRWRVLLVIDSRGHGGFAGLLLGSVGNQLTGHTDCPVVGVPTTHH